MMTQAQIYSKRKSDAKAAVIMLYKRQKEEKLLIDQHLDNKDGSEEDLKKLNEQLRIVASGKEVAKKRIEWLCKGTNFKYVFSLIKCIVLSLYQHF